MIDKADMSDKVVVATGKRKMSIAKATVKDGKGIIRINKVFLDNWGQELAREKVKEPLLIADDIVKNVNISVNVRGGGFMSQAEAARLAIAKGLVAYTGDKNLKKKFLEYDRHLLVADVRRTEPQKPCRSAARAGKQTSKR